MQASAYCPAHSGRPSRTAPPAPRSNRQIREAVEASRAFGYTGALAYAINRLRGAVAHHCVDSRHVEDCLQSCVEWWIDMKLDEHGLPQPTLAECEAYKARLLAAALTDAKRNPFATHNR